MNLLANQEWIGMPQTHIDFKKSYTGDYFTPVFLHHPQQSELRVTPYYPHSALQRFKICMSWKILTTQSMHAKARFEKIGTQNGCFVKG